MYRAILVILFVISNVTGFGLNRRDLDLTEAIHGVYGRPPPPPDHPESEESRTKPDPSAEEYGDISQDELHKSIKEIYPALGNPKKDLPPMPTVKKLGSSNPDIIDASPTLYLDPEVLKSIFESSTPEIEYLVSTEPNNTTNVTLTKFNTDDRFLSSSMLRGAFHNDVDHSEVKPRSMIIPLDSSTLSKSRSTILDPATSDILTSTNMSSESAALNHVVLLIAFCTALH